MDRSDRFLSGVVEGFYGPPWLQEERFELFDWLHEWRCNTYLYAPKDDLKHRAIWREPYSVDELRSLSELIQGAARQKIAFIYALAPGLDLQYSRGDEIDAIKHRLNQMLSIGCEHFALLFDDIPDALHPEDAVVFDSFAAAQARVTNAIATWTHQRAPKGRFLFCPTAYCGRMVSRGLGGANYLERIGLQLSPDVDILWTGPEIISASIKAEDIPIEILRRKPVLWDNLHANDYDRSRFYCGPYAGRDPRILTRVSGILTNPNNEFALNYIPIRTLAMFLLKASKWNARSAFEKALREWRKSFATVRGEITLEQLRLFADCYYLPHENGVEAENFFASAPQSLRGDEKGTAEFREGVKVLREFCHRATELRDRRLFHALSARVWDLREELDLLERFVDFRAARKESDSFSSDFHLPKTYRGGFVRSLRSLLARHPDGTFTVSDDQA